LKEIRSEIEIQAPAERVWNVLVDFQKYGEWNPFVFHVIGEPKLGEKIKISVRTPRGKERNYEPRITIFDIGHELRWVGKSLLLHGEHVFLLESTGSRSSRLLHSEVFSGLLSGFFGKDTDNDIAEGFRQMNEALKRRTELMPG
jgi:hypothetical protein